MNLWRINLKPGSAQGVDSAEFCINGHIAGIGWAIDPAPTSKDDYWTRAKQWYFAKYKRKWSAAAKAILYGIAVGDLIWTRNRKGSYFLGRIRGEWVYGSTEDHRRADIVNLRECDWVSVGTMDNVPGAVISSFIPRRTVQRVKDSSALHYSRYLYAKVRGEVVTPDAQAAQADILELLSDEDLEDVAAVYLQLAKRLIMFPSTCKSDTMAVECILTSPEGERVGLQVKRGNEPINQDQFASFDGTVYLFQARGKYQGQPNSRCVCLAPADMRAFVLTNRRLMPGRIQRWLDYLGEDGTP